MATVKKTVVKKSVTPALKDVFVTFSIGFTGVYITASLKQQSEEQIEQLLKTKLGEVVLFSKVLSKSKQKANVEFDFNLLKNKDGSKTKSHIKVAQAFKILEDFGWSVEREAFVEYYWPSK